MDGSFVPLIGAAPTLTIVAAGLRVGDHIAEQIGTTRHLQPGTVRRTVLAHLAYA